jgi:hypothetical protein
MWTLRGTMTASRAFGLGLVLLIFIPILFSAGCMMLQGRVEDWRTERRD